MTKNIALINTAAHTYQDWVDKTNEIANAVTQECVTINAAANGSLSTGKGFVEGTFGSRTAVANTLRGGTVETAAVLTISTNVAFTGSNLTMGSVTINSSDVVVNGFAISSVPTIAKISVNTDGVSAQLITSFDKGIYRGADIILTIKDTSAGSPNSYQISRLLVVHNNVDAVSTEYGDVYTNASMGQYSANIVGVDVRIYLTPASYVDNSHISGSITLIGV